MAALNLGGSISWVACHPFGRSVATYRYEVDVQHIIEVRSEAGLYEQHRRQLMRFATTLVGSSDAGDVVSDAMESLCGFNGPLQQLGESV